MDFCNRRILAVSRFMPSMCSSSLRTRSSGVSRRFSTVNVRSIPKSRAAAAAVPGLGLSRSSSLGSGFIINLCRNYTRGRSQRLLLILNKKRTDHSGPVRVIVDQIALRSELELQGKLKLPRRACVSCWCSGTTNYTESCASDLSRATRLAEVWVVEDVKDFCSELNHRLLAKLCPLNDGKVSVVECRAVDCVAPQAAKVINGLSTEEGYRQYKHRPCRATATGTWVTHQVGEPLNTKGVRGGRRSDSYRTGHVRAESGIAGQRVGLRRWCSTSYCTCVACQDGDRIATL